MIDQFKQFSKKIQIVVASMLGMVACALFLMLYLLLIGPTSPSEAVLAEYTAPVATIRSQTPAPVANQEIIVTATVGVPTVYRRPTDTATPTNTPTLAPTVTRQVTDSSIATPDIDDVTAKPAVTPDFSGVLTTVTPSESVLTADPSVAVELTVTVAPTEVLLTDFVMRNNTEKALLVFIYGTQNENFTIAPGGTNRSSLPTGNYQLEIRLPNGVEFENFILEGVEKRLRVDQNIVDENFSVNLVYEN